MRTVLQRVTKASVKNIENPEIPAEHIGPGLVLLIGISDTDTEEILEKMCKKIVNMRIFEDENGKMNLSAKDISAQILSVSQFTLFANIRKGNRPSFFSAGKPEYAQKMWKKFNQMLRDEGIEVKEVQFGTHMQVELINDGPVTIFADTDADLN